MTQSRLSWDCPWQPRGVPPRSRLFALRPVGLGTEHVEALTSYLTRLARAHGVNPRRLIREEFAKAAPNAEHLRWPARHSDDAGTMNGYGVYAETFATITADLTTVPDVRYLTLLPLADLLPRTSASVICRRPRWCPECLAEMVATSVEVARPLVWSLTLYPICHLHGRPLIDRCVTCGRYQPFLPTYPDLTHCAYCGASLIILRRRRTQASPVELRLAEWLAELVARLRDLDGIATQAHFMGLLKEAIDNRVAGNRAGFCKSIGLPAWTVKNWLLRGERPSLRQLLVVALGMGVRPVALLLEGAADGAQGGNASCLRVGRRSKRRRPLTLRERECLGVAMGAAVVDPEDTRSLAELARTFGFSVSCLRYWFPDECIAVRDKHAEAVTRAVASRRDAERQVVEKVVRQIASRGEYPGRRRVNEALALHHVSLAQQDMVAAYRRAVTDCGNIPRPREKHSP